jgi:hypothetical protein
MPANRPRAISVRTEMIIPTEVAPMSVAIAQWFVPGVGFIKQEVRFEINGHMLMHNTMTLEKFERAASTK